MFVCLDYPKNWFVLLCLDYPDIFVLFCLDYPDVCFMSRLSRLFVLLCCFVLPGLSTH